MPEILIPEPAVRELITATPENPNPHLIWHDRTVRVVTPGEWRDRYQPRGATLIITRDDLAEVAPAAVTVPPTMLAPVLGDYASSLDANGEGFARTPGDPAADAFYAMLRLDGCDDAAGAPAPIRILAPAQCEHGYTICTDCAESWSWDWTICWNLTPAGRRLRARVAARNGLAL
jgi:hypothetical protein